MAYIDEVFERGGAFDEHLDTYEVRPGQIELARAFDRAIEASRPLMAEGPCGVGKSFSYLVPSIYHSTVNKVGRSIIVTANIALQEQLVKKDLPFLRSVLPWPFTFGLAKGRNNYLCLHKRHEIEQRASFDSSGLPTTVRGLTDDMELHELRDLWRWTTETISGDKSDCESGTMLVWWRLSSSQDDCLGSGCPFDKVCWANLARCRAMASDIVVMNYHLRLVGNGVMTPKHAIMVCDEAHEIATIARDFLGWTLTVNQVNRVASWLYKNGSTKLSARLRELGSRLFDTNIPEMMNKQAIVRLYDPAWVDVDELVECFERANKIAMDVANVAKSDIGECLCDEDMKGARRARVECAKALKISENALNLAYRFRVAVDLSNEGWVFWTTQDFKQKRFTIEARPIEVADIVSRMFFPTATSSVMLISATMTSGGSFNYVREQIGVPETAGEIVAPSPFALKEQGLLLVPCEMSPPPTYGDRSSELAFQNDICYYSEELIKMCGGRSLLLFSSWKNLNYVYGYLSEKSDVCTNLTLFKQGELPPMKLLARFKEDETSVLLGVATFWAGVDVPGRSLTGLLIDKIPFGSPTDPINKAIDELLKSRGRNVFMERAVPEATIKLRQGSGRLIRTRSDVGIMIITDTRLLTTPYGEGIVSSLPEFLKVRSLGRARAIAEKLLEEV